MIEASCLKEGREYLEVWDLQMLVHIVHLFDLLGCSSMSIITAFAKLPEVYQQDGGDFRGTLLSFIYLY